MTNITILEFRQEINSKGEAEDWIKYGPTDDIRNTQTECPVRYLMPPKEFNRDPKGIKRMHMTSIWGTVQPAYEAWKQGEEMPEYGTPIGAWAALNKAQVSILKQSNIRSVEEIRDMPESVASKIRLPGVRDLIKRAATYLDGADRATLAKEKVDSENRIQALEERLEAAMAIIEQQKAAKPEPKKAKAAA